MTKNGWNFITLKGKNILEYEFRQVHREKNIYIFEEGG